MLLFKTQNLSLARSTRPTKLKLSTLMAYKVTNWETAETSVEEAVFFLFFRHRMFSVKRGCVCEPQSLLHCVGVFLVRSREDRRHCSQKNTCVMLSE